ncbi:R3H-associated N-terminal domain-containing protein [Boeremia exigua]|uniref:R3H-associated N-terminal domain-containing protein n=1 Tax=Boeremia exigua TaxID=749465 RepID=UPI001E8EC801|nr:R3H-associated N-terminal domain-containing protein [Boeremia exigua]KAH6612026.1 R3H-associated N-terminal domain-containing protein [Boeremia exigua]
MAIDDITAPQAAVPQPIDIAAWTEQATAAMGSVAISTPAPIVQGTSVVFDIPLDELDAPARPALATTGQVHTVYKRKELVRRDSLKRREAVLKGKEGSRRRQRWENDRLLNNPHAEPPAPHDWEVHPTHRVRNVPYYLAPLWDAGLKRQSTKRHDAAVAEKNATKTVANKPTVPGVVPKELREKLKRSRGAKGLLMDLEGEVRRFVSEWEANARAAEEDGLPTDPDSEDEEIVFVGRNGQTHDHDGASAQLKRELMLFETPEGDNGGTFGRWLVHHIGVYYGLTTWSVTVGTPARREAYIGIKDPMRSGRRAVCSPMPTPLWGMV